MGGLVNKAAFKSIATVKAKDATARADAADGDPDGDEDCNKLSALSAPSDGGERVGVR